MLTAPAALPAVFVGTSRGGILTMLLAATRPTGPMPPSSTISARLIKPKGLMRIIDGIGLERPLPPLWVEFDALIRVPVM
jgi:hypothetical protein